MWKKMEKYHPVLDSEWMQNDCSSSGGWLFLKVCIISSRKLILAYTPYCQSTLLSWDTPIEGIIDANSKIHRYICICDIKIVKSPRKDWHVGPESIHSLTPNHHPSLPMRIDSRTHGWGKQMSEGRVKKWKLPLWFEIISKSHILEILTSSEMKLLISGMGSYQSLIFCCPS